MELRESYRSTRWSLIHFEEVLVRVGMRAEIVGWRLWTGRVCDEQEQKRRGQGQVGQGQGQVGRGQRNRDPLQAAYI